MAIRIVDLVKIVDAVARTLALALFFEFVAGRILALRTGDGLSHSRNYKRFQ